MIRTYDLKIYPSVAAIDYQKQDFSFLLSLFNVHCDMYHADIMDGTFVPEISHDLSLIEKLKKREVRPTQVHLMVQDPIVWIDRLTMLHPHDEVLFHVEAVREPDGIKKVADYIRTKYKCRVGIAVHCDTPVESIYPLLPLVDTLLIVSVQPGASGRPMSANAITVIDKYLIHRIQATSSIIIGVDGGISMDNIGAMARKHVDFVCIGSALFYNEDPLHALARLTRVATYGTLLEEKKSS